MSLPTVLHEAEALATGGRRPLLSWDPVAGAASYRVYVTNETTEQRGLVDTLVSKTSVRLPQDFDYGRHRYWVRAVTVGGYESQWSASRVYDVPLTHISPSNATLETAPEFRWHYLPNAVTYGLFVSGPGGVLINESNITSETFTPSTPLPIGELRWWVRGFTASGKAGPWSPVVEISTGGRTRIGTINVDTVGASFSWLEVPGAQLYEVYLRNSASDGGVYRIEGTTRRSLSRLPLVSGDYTAWVRTTRADGNKIWSAGSRFVVPAKAHQLTPKPISSIGSFGRLVNGIFNSLHVTLDWEPVPNASGYEVFLRANATRPSQFVMLPGLKRVSPRTPHTIYRISPGELTWWVRAVFDDNEPGEWSVSHEVITNGRVTDVRYTATAANEQVLHWGQIEDANRYALQVDNLTTGEARVIREDDLTSASFPVATPLPRGKYRIWVRAISDRDEMGPWSIQRDFVVE